MIKLACKVPSSVEVALSGGPDSVAALHFLSRNHRKVSAAFVNHGTETSNMSQPVVESLCSNLGIPLRIMTLSPDSFSPSNKEERWRESRYEFFDQSEYPVVTAHHLDDAVEWWIFSSIHGKGKLIPRVRGNYLRPFLLTKKEALL